jgi:hypothetical protein
MKTLIVILGETRASDLTFNKFKENVYDKLNADLCVCIGVQPDYDYNDPFYQLAKYKFLYNESTEFSDSCKNAYDYSEAFEKAYKEISDGRPEYESYDDLFNLIPLHWQEFFKIKCMFMGGLKNEKNSHVGSGGILIFFRWFLLKNLNENNLINEYDRFIITRSDYIYNLPFPKLELMSPEYIWIPNGEYYEGYTDRQVVLSKTNIKSYLNILSNMTLRSNEYYNKMKSFDEWNFERLIKFHLEQNNVVHLVREYPYIMYTVRRENGRTTWGYGEYSHHHGYYIKYMPEYYSFCKYKQLYESSGYQSIDDFYATIIKN